MTGEGRQSERRNINTVSQTSGISEIREEFTQSNKQSQLIHKKKKKNIYI